MEYIGNEDFDSSLKANRIENDEIVYRIGVIYIDEDISYLVQLFETNDFTDGAPGMAYYIPVKTDSVERINVKKLTK